MQNHKLLPRPAIVGIAGGMLLMPTFTAAWSITFAVSVANPLAYGLLGVFLLISLYVAANSLHLLSNRKKFPVVKGTAEVKRGKRMGMAWGIAFGTEGLLIGVASSVLSSTNKNQYIVPVIALITGLHFYPFAKIFQRTVDYYIATWLSLVALIGIYLLVRGTKPSTAHAVVALAAATSTTAYGLYMLRVKQHAINTIH